MGPISVDRARVFHEKSVSTWRIHQMCSDVTNLCYVGLTWLKLHKITFSWWRRNFISNEVRMNIFAAAVHYPERGVPRRPSKPLVH